jgi:hypothetical protein
MPRIHQTKKHGFALVISLGLMAFVVLLIISISTLVQVNTSRVAIDNTQLTAKMNALLALKIAIGELQKAAGADQRVTAQSFILEEEEADLQASEMAQPMWTQVWSTTASLSDTNWPVCLVSGDNPDPTSGPDADKSITLVGTETLGLLETDDKRVISVETEEIKEGDTTVGNYAWWVGDEGVKASLNTGISEATEPWLQPNRFAPDATESTLASLFEADSISGTTISERLHSRKQTSAYSSESGSIVNANFHDYTIRADNLLTDVVNGGFRKNLTAALNSVDTDDESEFTELLDDPFNTGGAQIFPPQLTGIASDSPQEPDPGGPYWRLLASYFQTRVDNTADATAPIRPQTDEETGIYPILQMAQIYFYAGLTPASSDPSLGYLRYLITPVITLWNPYNVQIELENGRVDLMTTLNGNRPVMHARWTEDENEQTLEVDTDWYQILDMCFHLPSSIILEPGETKMFSVSEHAAFDNANNNLTEGLYYGYGFYKDWTNDTVPLTDVEVAVSHQRQPQEAIWSLWKDSDSSNTAKLPAGTKLQEIGCKYVFLMGMPTTQMNLGNTIWDKDGDGEFTYNWSEHYTPTVINSNSDPATSNFPAFGYKTALHIPESSVVPTHSDSTINASIFALFKWLVHSNPRAPQLFGPEQINITENNSGWQNLSAPTVFLELLADASSAYLLVHDDEDGSAFTGYSDTQGVNEMVLFDIPRSDVPIESIGAFSDAPLLEPSTEEWNPYRVQGEGGSYSPETTRSFSWGPSYAIGNSWADLRIPPEESYYQYLPSADTNGGKVAYDLSWLLNEALWDHYYLTGMEVDNGSYNRIRPISTEETDSPELDTYEDAGPLLKLTAGFNVNSTSVAAWEAFIASTWNTDIPGASSESTELAPILRYWYPRGDDPGTGGGGVMTPESYVGYRRLSESEISELAEAIVLQVKKRGPFKSIADFVNRSLTSSDSTLQLSGALQTAIDSTSINQNLSSPSLEETDLESTLASQLGNPAAFSGSVVANIPGYLTQADLLARLGASITVRSDTFIIRAYGDALNPLSGGILSQAWVEATVQRTPERISGDIQDTGTGDIDDMGRRFQVISINWLDEEESD